MTSTVIRHLAPGEEALFDSMPDPLPQVRKMPYADGLAGGGYHPTRTWIALHDEKVVARAAWALLPNAHSAWLDRLELTTQAPVGAELLTTAHQAMGGPTTYHATLPGHWRHQPDAVAAATPALTAARLAGLTEQGERHRCSWTGAPLPAPSGRYTFRPATDADEINTLVAQIEQPDLLTGAETALAVNRTDLARDPLSWLTGPITDWRVALRDNTPVGLAAPTAHACFPMIAYLGLRDPHCLPDLLADAVASLEGAHEVLADVDAHRVTTVAELERTGFRRLRSQITFTP